MSNLLFLIFCLLIGFLLRRVRVVREQEGHLVLNQLLLYVCLPAATLLHTSVTRFELQYILPILMPWGLFLGSWLFFRVLRRLFKFHPHTEVILILTSGIPSVSFVGFPIFEMLYGEAGMKAAVLMSQAGSFLVCSTLGVMLATVYSATNIPKDDSFRDAQFLKNILRFPPFLAFCVALVVNFSGFTLPEFVVELLRKLAAPFSFLALVSVGMQMDFKSKNLQWQHLKWGLGYKLIIAPLMILIFVLTTHPKGMIAEMCVLGAALGPMNTVAIIASSYGLNPKLAAQMVGIGIPLSLITTAFWYCVLWGINYF